MLKNTITFLITLATIILVPHVFADPVEKIENALTDSITVNTANVVHQIKVSLKAFGPGLCNVQIFDNGTPSVLINAPPLIWSDWHSASAALLSESTVTISKTDNCDTGTLMRVKYWANES